MTPDYYIMRDSALAYADFSEYSLSTAKFWYEDMFAKGQMIRFDIKAAETIFSDTASFSVGIRQGGKTVRPATIYGLKNDYPSMSSAWPDTPAYYRHVDVGFTQASLDVTQPVELLIRYFDGNELVYKVNLLQYVN